MAYVVSYDEVVSMKDVEILSSNREAEVFMYGYYTALGTIDYIADQLLQNYMDGVNEGIYKGLLRAQQMRKKHNKPELTEAEMEHLQESLPNRIMNEKYNWKKYDEKAFDLALKTGDDMSIENVVEQIKICEEFYKEHPRSSSEKTE